MKTYHIACPGSIVLHPLTHSRRPDLVMAARTGQFRCPRAGEWFLSGALPEAYKAENDLSTAYHILRLVVVKTINTTVIEEFSEKPRCRTEQ
jgi:hypothetical protein